jgi:hypothetical protein
MYRRILIASLLATAACSPRGGQLPSPHPAAVDESRYHRVPDRVGDFVLTERSAIGGMPDDTIFRFRDGSAARVSVFVYDVGEDVMAEPDTLKWASLEAEKFEAVQELRRSRGEITAYVVSVSDTARIPAGDRQVLEHSLAVPVRSRDDRISIEFQYLYLIGRRFVKVRATVPEQGWEQTKVRSFARELVQHMARGT